MSFSSPFLGGVFGHKKVQHATPGMRQHHEHKQNPEGSWRALIASWLGWMFDGYETYGLVLVMAPAVHQLLPPEKLPSASLYFGGLLAATMVG